jgi:dTMP kinase
MLRGVALAKAIAADRRAHVTGMLAPALAGGKLVVCDRYLLSSYVFHPGDGMPSALVTELNRMFPAPSLNLILHADEGTIRRRLGLRGGTTRLQAADSPSEFAQYIRFAKLMELQGIAYEVCDNASRETQHAIVGWLLELRRSDDWSA